MLPYLVCAVLALAALVRLALMPASRKNLLPFFLTLMGAILVIFCGAEIVKNLLAEQLSDTPFTYFIIVIVFLCATALLSLYYEEPKERH